MPARTAPRARTITPDYGQLVGVRIAGGYRDAIRRLFGRTAGCTHINELAGVMGSAAMQALWGVMSRDSETQADEHRRLPCPQVVGSAGRPLLSALVPARNAADRALTRRRSAAPIGAAGPPSNTATARVVPL